MQNRKLVFAEIEGDIKGVMACYRFVFIAVFALTLASTPIWAASEKSATKSPSLLKIVRPFTLRLPIACKIGTDCWVLNYPDVGPLNDNAAIDTACLARTYEGHKGTDIAIADAAAMNAGVDVLAAHDGTVMRVRNDVEDHFPLTEEQLAKIKAEKKECGNAVLIDHGEGWQTMYCHMKRGSIIVKPQQKIKAGDKIGQVGASGMTEFPHIHLGVIRKTDVMDPFTGRSLTEDCGTGGAPLFEKSAGISYQPLTFMKLGFDQKPVTIEKLDQGEKQPATLSTEADALVFYAVMLGVRAGDEITLRIEDDAGKVFSEKTTVQDKNRARQMLYVGRKIREGSALEPGIYNGKVTIKRKDEIFSDARAINLVE